MADTCLSSTLSLSLKMLRNGSSARAYSRADKAVLLQDPVRPWLYPKSRTRVCPCRNEHKTQSGELARGKGSAHLPLYSLFLSLSEHAACFQPLLFAMFKGAYFKCRSGNSHQLAMSSTVQSMAKLM